MLRRLRKVAWAGAAVPVLAVVRAGLSFASYARLRRIIPTGEGGANPSLETIGRCAWALQRGSYLVPGASCLTQALAGQWLLATLGYTSRVIVGVRSSDTGLAAHAWLLASGRTVIGGQSEDLDRFTPLTELGRRP